MKKKKILFQSDFSLAKTGFGRNAKAILKYLYSTGKYDIVHYCGGMNYSNPQLLRTPWKSVGCLPDNQQETQRLSQSPEGAKAGYGIYYLDRIIQEEKPDIYLAVQDIWGVDFAIDKPWFKKINSVVWTTLDSLPILPSAIEAAKKCKNYWVWSNFAEKELHKLGQGHVKTLHGALEDKYFYRLEDHQRKELRKNFGISNEDFIIGFVFRNQLRKSVPNLLEGFKLLKERHPEIKRPRLLLHTHFDEGWNIVRLANEYKIAKQEILTTYICGSCHKFEVKPFEGQAVKCRFCNNEKSQGTANVSLGVSESQLNEVYNLMDVYVHPFTSGGQEIPIQEAKLTELITLVTNYSCGEEMCEEEASSLPLDWSEYREHGTEFKKASTSPSSIAKQIQRVYRMSESKRREMGGKARNWVIDNFGVESVCKKLEDFFDSCPFVDFQSTIKENGDPNHMVPEIKDDIEWLLFMYHNILKRKEVDANDGGLKYWIAELGKGIGRPAIEDFFRKTAREEVDNKNQDFSKLLDPNDEGKRILFVLPESAGDIYMATSLFKSLKDQYPDHNLYVAVKPEYFEVLEGNPYVFKVLSYIPQMDNLLWLEGFGSHRGYFEVAYLAHVGTQRIFNYQHNGKDKIALDLKYAHS